MIARRRPQMGWGKENLEGRSLPGEANRAVKSDGATLGPNHEPHAPGVEVERTRYV